ncbi:MAG TPA: hypothetical protein VGE72_01525, partial [Azospirillum sp.]
MDPYWTEAAARLAALPESQRETALRVMGGKQAEALRQVLRQQPVTAHPAAAPMTAEQATSIIQAERQRQIAAEGYTAEHDDEHGVIAFLKAATAYRTSNPTFWPWDAASFKPKGQRRDLERAGALA